MAPNQAFASGAALAKEIYEGMVVRRKKCRLTTGALTRKGLQACPATTSRPCSVALASDTEKVYFILTSVLDLGWKMIGQKMERGI